MAGGGGWRVRGKKGGEKARVGGSGLEGGALKVVG